MSRTLPSVAQGQRTMSKAAATSRILASMLQDGDLAAAAGGGPVDGQLALGLGRGGLGGGRLALMTGPPSLLRVPWRCSPGPPGGGRLRPVGRPVERPELADVLDQPVDRLGQLLAFGGRGPDQPDAVRLDAQCRKRVLEHGVAAHGLVVLLDVVAFAGMAAGDQHAVGAPGPGPSDEARDRPARCTSRG